MKDVWWNLLWFHMSTWAPAVAKRSPSHWWSTALKHRKKKEENNKYLFNKNLAHKKGVKFYIWHILQVKAKKFTRRHFSKHRRQVAAINPNPKYSYSKNSKIKCTSKLKKSNLSIKETNLGFLTRCHIRFHKRSNWNVPKSNTEITRLGYGYWNKMSINLHLWT